MVPRPSSNRLNIEKVNFHETSAGVVPERFQGPKMAPKTAQDRPKTGPRSSWISFFRLDFSLRFLIVLGSILVPFWPPKWCPWGECKLGLGPLGPIQNGPKIVLVRSFFRLVVRDRFFGRLGLLLGPFLGAPGVVLVLFRHFNSSIQPVNSSTRRFNSSTHQPMALRHFLTRPGGLRAARLNPPPPEGSERV